VNALLEIMAEGFDAFISYSRVDRVFSELLEQSLEGFKPPSHLAVPPASAEGVSHQ
jgi:hypothetical protein